MRDERKKHVTDIDSNSEETNRRCSPRHLQSVVMRKVQNIGIGGPLHRPSPLELTLNRSRGGHGCRGLPDGRTALQALPCQTREHSKVTRRDRLSDIVEKHMNRISSDPNSLQS